MARFFQLLLVAIAICAVNYTRFALGPLQEAAQLDLRLSDGQMAMLQGLAIGVPLAIATIPIGLLLNRYRRVRLLITFVILSLTGAVVTALASTFVVLFAARMLIGLALAVMAVSAYSVVGDLYPPSQRGRATMVVTIGELSAGPLAFALGGVLLSAAIGTSAHNGLASWRWTLLCMTAPLLVIPLLLLAVREPPRTSVSASGPSLSDISLELWRYRGVAVPLLLSRTMVFIADGAVLVWGAPTFTRKFALTPDRTGAIMATALLIAGISGPALGGPLADFCQRTGGPRRSMTALCLLTLASVPAALFGVMPNATDASIGLTALLTVGFAVHVVAFAIVNTVIPSELRAPYVGVTFTVAAIVGLAIAPIVVSELSGLLGGTTMVGTALAIVCGVTSLLGTAFFALGRKYLPPNGGSLLTSGDQKPAYITLEK